MKCLRRMHYVATTAKVIINLKHDVTSTLCPRPSECSCRAELRGNRRVTRFCYAKWPTPSNFVNENTPCSLVQWYSTGLSLWRQGIKILATILTTLTERLHIPCRGLPEKHNTIRITNSMEQSPSLEADSHSASREIPHLLWNPKAHYCVHNSPPLALPSNFEALCNIS
jgi:hypothetical protein